MDFLKELFGENSLSFEEFSKAVGGKGLKLGDLSKGEYVAKGKLTDATERIKALENDINGLKEKLDGTEDVQPLKDKIKELADAITARDEADRQAAQENAYMSRFSSVKGENKFLNEFTEKGIFDEFKTALADKGNEGKSDSDVFSALIKDREGIFESKNQLTGIPGIGPNIKAGDSETAQARSVMGLPAEK